MAHRTLLALDIDGVLKPSMPLSDSPTWVRINSPWQGGFDIDLDLIDVLNALDVDIVWLTTWFEDAPEAFGGLIDAPVLRMLDDRSTASWWKRGSLGEHVAQGGYERVVWIDDELDEREPEELGVDELRICPHPMRGLGPDEMAQIIRWVRSSPTTA